MYITKSIKISTLQLQRGYPLGHLLGSNTTSTTTHNNNDNNDNDSNTHNDDNSDNSNNRNNDNSNHMFASDSCSEVQAKPARADLSSEAPVMRFPTASLAGAKTAS